MGLWLIGTMAGCGAVSLSEHDLRDDAALACAITQARLDGISIPSSPSAARAFLNRGVTLLARELRQLDGMRAPAALAGDYRGALAASAADLAALRTTIAELRDGADPTTAFRSLQARLVTLRKRTDAAWRALGIPDCVTR